MLKKRDAENIASKLQGKKKPGGKHLWVKFRIDGKPYKFSIRHGAKSDHSHLVHDLRLSLRKLQQLAECTMSPEKYFEIQRGKFTA